MKGNTKLVNGINAYIGENATITSGENINVRANDILSSLMISGTIAVGGGGAGVSVGISVGVMNSNVAAQVAEGAKLNAGNDITIHASTGGGKTSTGLNGNAEAGEVTAYTNNQNDKDPKDPTQTRGEGKTGKASSSAVRMIGVVLAGGMYAGVGVGLGTLVVTSEVKSIMAGKVESAQNLNIESEMNFGDVLTTVVSAGAGIAGVGVSVAGAWFEGKTTTAITDTAEVGQETGKTVGNITVSATGHTKATAAAASVAGGVAGVAVNGAVAYNSTDIDTYISQGAKVKTTQNITVSSNFDTKSDAWVVAISAGAVGVGVSVVTNVAMTDSRTYIGARFNGPGGSRRQCDGQRQR